MITLDPAIPAAVRSCFEEGALAASVHAPRAAVVMFRAALAEVVEAVGSDEAKAKDTLFKQLAQMEADGSLHPHLVEWAREIRLLGNIGAHPSSLGAVTDEEADDLARLTRQLLEVLFVVPASIARARQAREQPVRPDAIGEGSITGSISVAGSESGETGPV